MFVNPRRLYRSRRDRRIAGVAGGVAEYLDVDPTVIRVLWIISVFFGGFGLLLYIIMAFIVPLEPMAGPTVGAPPSSSAVPGWQAPAGPAPAGQAAPVVPAAAAQAAPAAPAAPSTPAPEGASTPPSEAPADAASDAPADDAAAPTAEATDEPSTDR
jgi:phage shock protein PspC (stress-responsive transcriptional regulator)